MTAHALPGAEAGARPILRSGGAAAGTRDADAAPTLEERLALAGVILLGFVYRVWCIAWGLHNANISRRPHPDEWTVYYLFHWFDHTHSLNPCPSYPGQCFFDWGSAFPYLAYVLHFVLAPFVALVPASAFGAQADPGFVRLVLAARIVSAIASTATIYVVYRLARLAFGRWAGLIAALLVAISALLIQLAHFATPDSTTILLLSLALLAIYRMTLDPSRNKILIAGALVGVATGSEYHMVLLSCPFLAAWWLSGHRRLIDLALAAGAAVLAFLVLNIYLIPDFPGFRAAVEHTLRIRTVDSGLEYRDRWAPYDPAWLFVVRYPLGYGVGFALTAWMLIGVAWSGVRRTHADLILLAWLAPYFLLVTLEPAKFMRYSAPLLIPLAILGARFAWDVLRASPRFGRFSLAILLAATIVFTGSYDAAYAGMFATKEPRSTAMAWVNAHARPGQAVAFEELPDGVLTMPFFLKRGLRACFLQQHPNRLAGADFVLLDSYTREGLSTRSNFQNARVITDLARSTDFRRVTVINDQPRFLGVRFPISGSPHDWRYLSHRITIYQRVAGVSRPGSYCFTDLNQAANALYIPPAQR